MSLAGLLRDESVTVDGIYLFDSHIDGERLAQLKTLNGLRWLTISDLECTLAELLRVKFTLPDTRVEASLFAVGDGCDWQAVQRLAKVNQRPCIGNRRCGGHRG